MDTAYVRETPTPNLQHPFEVQQPPYLVLETFVEMRFPNRPSLGGKRTGRRRKSAAAVGMPRSGKGPQPLKFHIYPDLSEEPTRTWDPLQPHTIPHTNSFFFFPPNTWPCLLATANFLQGTCNRLVFLLTTAPHSLHDCPPLGSLVIS